MEFFYDVVWPFARLLCAVVYALLMGFGAFCFQFPRSFARAFGYVEVQEVQEAPENRAGGGQDAHN